MSDVAKNALRYYGITNAIRSDAPNPHNGQVVGKLSDGSAILGFDCSGFFCHVMIESGYRINYEPCDGYLKSASFETISENELKPGDMILFTGHIGIVTEYDHASSIGRFIHMSGSNNIGSIKISYFVTNIDKLLHRTDHTQPTGPNIKSIKYGNTKPIVSLRRIKKNHYSNGLDLHLDNSNPNPTLTFRVRPQNLWVKNRISAPERSLV